MNTTLIGPFSQILTMNRLNDKGPIPDNSLEVIHNGGILIDNGLIKQTGRYSDLNKRELKKVFFDFPATAVPGLIDAHTHICFAGSRSDEYAMRLSGLSYQEIAERGGGILNTVRETRKASEDDLVKAMNKRLDILLERGITTCEVKSGYGLSKDDEFKMLRSIRTCGKSHPLSIVPTLLAAHMTPPEFKSKSSYLSYILEELLPVIKKENLSKRADIFVEPEAFEPEIAKEYMCRCKKEGFTLTVHANQFSSGGAAFAAELGAVSADHLEVITEDECKLLSNAGVIGTVLPGASIGLGTPFAPARKMLDLGLSVAIASDWNPGTAPMGDLLTQAAILGVSQRLTMAETFSGITFRAAKALELEDRGVIDIGKRADIAIFPCDKFQEILYHQGSMRPCCVIIQGVPFPNAGKL